MFARVAVENCTLGTDLYTSFILTTSTGLSSQFEGNDLGCLGKLFVDECVSAMFQENYQRDTKVV